jgi:flagellar biosynthetic protein FliR
MTALAPDAVLAIFVLFCRIGSCLMLMPGFSSPRVPVRVRLFLAISITLALASLLLDKVNEQTIHSSPFMVLQLAGSEIVIGVLIGLMGRAFFAALETLTNVIAMTIGIANPLGVSIEEAEPLPAIASLITMAATTLLFLTDLHWEVLRGLVASYTALPVSNGVDVQFNLVQLSASLSKSFFLSLRIASPFIVFSVIVNFAIGILGKLTPQIHGYFILTPAVLLGGLFLLYLTSKQFLELFILGFKGWLING